MSKFHSESHHSFQFGTLGGGFIFFGFFICYAIRVEIRRNNRFFYFHICNIDCVRYLVILTTLNIIYMIFWNDGYFGERAREPTNQRTNEQSEPFVITAFPRWIYSPNEYSAQKFLAILFVSVLFRMAYLGAQTVYVWYSHGRKMYICGIWSYRHHEKKIHTFISIICKLSNKKYVDNNNNSSNRNSNYHQEQEREPHQPNKRKEYDGNSFAYRISVNEWIARRNGSKC